MKWTKEARDQWICHVPPDARFTCKASIKGDGRWSWEVTSAGAKSPRAAGIVTNLGAAKRAAEQFLAGSGLM